MNVLYLAHRIPYPPDKGDKIRSFHQIRALSERHRIALVCFADDADDLRHAAALREFCSSVDVVYRSPRAARIAGLRGLLDGRSLSEAAFDSAALRRAVGTRLGPADVAVAFSSVMAQYVPSGSRIPRVMDFVDIDSDKWRLYAERRRGPAAWIYAREARRLGRYEEQVAREWDHSLFVSGREERLLAARVPGRPFTVLQNGVDLAHFNPAFAGATAPAAPARNGGGHGEALRIVFTGVMDYFPNVDGVRHFCASIFPRIRAALPEARFVIVGRNPARAVRALARQPGVEVTGTVPDVRPHLAGAAVSVAPLRIARGLQNKILEAMAMGLPVVGTSAAFEGLDAMRQAGARVADDPEAFATHVVELLRSPERRREAGSRARAYVERHHRWSDHGVALEALLTRVVAGASRPPGREAVT
ncbi:MAG TPA: TIGR03087 family PEP-CTERM/XrtA system glycosyltransferase [Candidatus Limnocylindrales bacterium]|nr:TIGR03087 family PEP-CTERM/XrtA system glycosyltransferase [Candidatus Limnocylindrales bacterium]